MESNFISIRPAVEFINILDQYSYNEDLICQFKFNDYVPQEGDRIALFRLGWNFVKDYIVFEWVPSVPKNAPYSVTFNRHILPKNYSEIYQICYISSDNELYGASCSFQFTADKVKGPGSTSMEASKIIEPNVSVSNNCSSRSQEIIEEMEKLKTENMMLKETLNLIISKKNSIDESKSDQNREIQALKEKMQIMSLAFSNAMSNFDSKNVHKSYDQDIQDLNVKVSIIQALFESQQKEIEMLKSKIVECGVEYKKLYLEKVKLEKKIEKSKNKTDYIKEGPNTFEIEDLKTLPPFPFPRKIN